MAWDPPLRPAELAESRLTSAILDGQFPIDGTLPPERDLAVQLGVTRPTLREALQRLAREGWIEIRHGRPTRVRDFWHEGSLGVLGTIAHHAEHVTPEFVVNLLEVRLALAPAYARLAIERSPGAVADLLQDYSELADTAQAYAEADWHLHRVLTLASGNPVFTLILNGFAELYTDMARGYFAGPATRRHSQAFYAGLLKAAQAGEAQAAERQTRRVMAESISLWRETTRRG